MGENLDKWYKYLRNTLVILTMEKEGSSVLFPWLPIPGRSSLSVILEGFHYEEIFITHFFYPYPHFLL